MKKIVALSVACILLLGSVVIAASINGDFEGFPIVNVNINGQPVESDVPAINFYGRTMLPVRAIAEALNSIVTWDSETWTANIVKPQVSMLFLSDLVDNDQDGYEEWLYHPFGYLEVGLNSFSTFTDVGEIEKGTYSVRVIIVDPEENTVSNSGEKSIEVSGVGFYHVYRFENLQLSKAGIYKVRFQLKQGESFVTIFEKNLPVI